MPTTAKPCPTREISHREIETNLRQGFEQGDQLRLDGLTAMVGVKRAKLIQTRRERARMEAKHGRHHPHVAELDRKMAVEHGQLVHARTERDRMQATLPERDPKHWILYGYVRDADGFALPDQRVGLYADAAKKGRALASATTNEQGCYQLEIAAEPAHGDETHPRACLDARYLRITDSRGKVLHRETTPVHPNAGGITYRDIQMPHVSRTDAGNLPTRYLANTHSRELHDLEEAKPGCCIGAIPPEHRAFFKTAELAAQAGYDYCAHCFGKDKSKR